MGFFSRKPVKTLFEVLNVNPLSYPNTSFQKITEVINEAGNKIFNQVGYFTNKEIFGLFSELTIVTFEISPLKNFCFRNPDTDFTKTNLYKLTHGIYDIYGSDDIGIGDFTSDDWNQIKEEGFWTGRMWCNEKYPFDCSLGYDDEGLFLTIFGI